MQKTVHNHKKPVERESILWKTFPERMLQAGYVLLRSRRSGSVSVKALITQE